MSSVAAWVDCVLHCCERIDGREWEMLILADRRGATKHGGDGNDAMGRVEVVRAGMVRSTDRCRRRRCDGIMVDVTMS